MHVPSPFRLTVWNYRACVCYEIFCRCHLHCINSDLLKTRRCPLQMEEALRHIPTIWSRDQKTVWLSWVTTMEWVGPLRLWPMEEAIQCIRMLGATSLPCRYKLTSVWIASYISTQLAPMVSPRHFATAPAPPATEQFGHCPKVTNLDPFPQPSYILRQERGRPFPATSAGTRQMGVDGSWEGKPSTIVQSARLISA